MPIAGSIESKIANWPAVRPPIIPSSGTNCILVFTKSIGVAPPCVTCVEMMQRVASALGGRSEL